MVGKKRLLKYASVFLLAVCIVLFFPFRHHIDATTNGTEISLESNPDCVEINSDTDQAVVVNEKSDSVSVVDLNIPYI